jgi:hypothetical protein
MTGPLPPLEAQLAEKLLSAFCESRVPAEVRDRVRLEFEIDEVTATLLECRRHWRDASRPWSRSPRARMRFDPKRHGWELLCRDRNAEWHSYGPLPRAKKLEELLAEISEDPTGVFWG